MYENDTVFLSYSAKILSVVFMAKIQVDTIQANFDYHLHLVLHHSLACFSRRLVCVSIELFYLFTVKYKLHILTI
jgi:hypothetical protein